MEFYKLGKTVMQLKSLFNWDFNSNMSLNGNVKLISDSVPYIGLGIKYNSKDSVDILKDSIYSIYIDSKYSLKTDVKLALNGIFNFIMGVDVHENKPYPYFNLIFNDNDEVKPKNKITLNNNTALERTGNYSYTTTTAKRF